MHVRMYTVSQKRARFNLLKLGQILTLLQNSFTVRKTKKFATRPV